MASTRRGIGEIFLGLGLDGMSLGFPEIPEPLRITIATLGVILVLVGMVTLAWPYIQGRIPTPFWLGRRLWPIAMWSKYPPQVRLVADPHIEYQVLDGRAKQCEMHIRVFVRNCLPIGVLKINQGSGSVTVKQRRFGKKQTYHLHSIAPLEMSLIPGGHHVFNFIFRWQHIGEVESTGPMLNNRFIWTLSNITAQFERHYNFARTLPRIGQDHLAPEI